MRLQIHANVRIRRIYFADRLYADDEMPNEFKMFLPPGAGGKKPSSKDKVVEKEFKKEEAKSDLKATKHEQTKDIEALIIKDDTEPSAAPPTPVPEEAMSPDG